MRSRQQHTTHSVVRRPFDRRARQTISAALSRKRISEFNTRDRPSGASPPPAPKPSNAVSYQALLFHPSLKIAWEGTEGRRGRKDPEGRVDQSVTTRPTEAAEIAEFPQQPSYLCALCDLLFIPRPTTEKPSPRVLSAPSAISCSTPAGPQRNRGLLAELQVADHRDDHHADQVQRQPFASHLADG